MNWLNVKCLRQSIIISRSRTERSIYAECIFRGQFKSKLKLGSGGWGRRGHWDQCRDIHHARDGIKIDLLFAVSKSPCVAHFFATCLAARKAHNAFSGAQRNSPAGNGKITLLTCGLFVALGNVKRVRTIVDAFGIRRIRHSVAVFVWQSANGGAAFWPNFAECSCINNSSLN